MNNILEQSVTKLFATHLVFKAGVFLQKEDDVNPNQSATTHAFSNKWDTYDNSAEAQEQEKLFQFQKQWYLKLYGFSSEAELAAFLQTKKYILDAGCGLGYKAAWFAELAPNSTVFAMDASDAIYLAQRNYKHLSNLIFIKGDISKSTFNANSIDYVSCDQVIMHTTHPEQTFAELSKITKLSGQFSCYVYAKKALPRELIDDYFRNIAKDIPHDKLMEMSEQLTQLGKTLSELNIKFVAPDIPLLGIKGGEFDLQRFIYWNFLKCFWNPELGHSTSVIVNYDWYSPTNAKRYSEEEYRQLISDNKLKVLYFHSEEACYSARLLK